MNTSALKTLIGIPHSQMHCWDLTKEFYRKVLGVELKHVAEDPKGAAERQNLIWTSVGDFQRVSEPRYGDIILIKVKGLESHIAVYLDDGLMLHTTESTGSVIDRTHKWARTFVGFYRPKELINDSPETIISSK